MLVKRVLMWHSITLLSWVDVITDKYEIEIKLDTACMWLYRVLCELNAL